MKHKKLRAVLISTISCKGGCTSLIYAKKAYVRFSTVSMTQTKTAFKSFKMI